MLFILQDTADISAELHLLSPKMFFCIYVAHAPGKYPVKLQPNAFKRVIAAFQKKLTAEFYYPPAEKKMTYGDVIIFQAAHYRKVIEGTADVYQPMILK